MTGFKDFLKAFLIAFAGGLTALFSSSVFEALKVLSGGSS